MNEADFETFLHRCIDSLQRKNASLESRYRLGHYARWDHDGELGVLTFSNPGTPDTVEAKTTDIGSYSLDTKTWLWAWANESNTDAERAKASRLKELFAITDMRVFQDAHIDADEYLAWELAAASVHQLESLGCYRGPVGHLWVFWSIDGLATGRRAD